MLLVLESFNENLEILIVKLQHCSSISSIELQQFYKKNQDGEEHFLLRTLDSRINSLQFYDIITQKLQHIIAQNRRLIKELRDIIQYGFRPQAQHFIIICPELMLLQQAVLGLIRNEYMREINEMESQFVQVPRELIPRQAIDIELGRHKTEIQYMLDEILSQIPCLDASFIRNTHQEVLETKRLRLQQVLSEFTMNTERELFCQLFEQHPVMEKLHLPVEEDKQDDEIELF
ncbi:MAG: hypothetical protein ACLFUB_00055 [Cyclobacteriaceae bacterium]